MGKNWAVFIDRDGTINQEVDNLNRLADLKLLPGVVEAIALLNKFRIPAIIITNQPVVARGWLTEQELVGIHQVLVSQLAEKGVKIDGIYYCPHHPEADLEKYRVVCECRKPGIAMLKKAAEDFRVDLSKSYLIGDSFRDIEAGQKAGCMTIAVESGSSDFNGSIPDFKVLDLKAGVKLIFEREKLA